MLQVTPAASLVVALRVRVCVTVRPARAGVTVTPVLAGLTLMISVALALCGCGVPESVTVTVTIAPLAVALGVPLTTPLGARPSPAGNALPCASFQVYGDVPPVAASAAEYATPTWPLGSAGV